METKKFSVYLMSLILAMTFLVPLGFTAQDDETAEATVTLGNTAPTIDIHTSTNANYDPTANTTTAVAIVWNCTDTNGVQDIEESLANFTVFSDSGRTVQQTIDSSPTPTNLTSDITQYSGSVNLNFYDTSATYYVRVSCGDDVGSVEDDSDTFDYNKLEDIVVPASISFGTIEEGQADVSSGEQIVTNVGNVDLDFNVTGANLEGVTTPAEFIAIGNFSIDDDAVTGSDSGTNTELALTTVTQLFSPYDGGDTLGNITAGASGNTYSLWFYLDMPTNGFSEQSFAGNWTLTGVEKP